MTLQFRNGKQRRRERKFECGDRRDQTKFSQSAWVQNSQSAMGAENELPPPPPAHQVAEEAFDIAWGFLRAGVSGALPVQSFLAEVILRQIAGVIATEFGSPTELSRLTRPTDDRSCSRKGPEHLRGDGKTSDRYRDPDQACEISGC